MQSSLSRFARNESGATSIEYGVIAGVICLGIFMSIGTIKTSLNTMFNTIAKNMNTGS